MKVNEAHILHDTASAFKKLYSQIHYIKNVSGYSSVSIQKIVLEEPMLTSEVREAIYFAGIRRLETLKAKLMLLGVDDFEGYEDIK